MASKLRKKRGRTVKLHMTDRAVPVRKTNGGLPKANLRIFVRYAGGIHFFMNPQDPWFLKGHSLKIDAQGDEIRFIAEEA